MRTDAYLHTYMQVCMRDAVTRVDMARTSPFGGSLMRKRARHRRGTVGACTVGMYVYSYAPRYARKKHSSICRPVPECRSWVGTRLQLDLPWLRKTGLPSVYVT